MTDSQRPASPANWLEEPKRLSEMLNVITILTFVGCGLAILLQLYSFVSAPHAYETLLQQQDKLDQIPAFFKSMMGGDPVTIARKTMENRTEMLILNLAAASLCLYGAIQMRQLKKVGFPIYVIGELLPFVAYVIFIGSLASFSMFCGILFSATFIIMYASQRKHLS